jgi:hypothetical protein
MASGPSTAYTTSNFEALFDAALAKYKKRTGQDLCNHPLAAIIDRCQSPYEILAIFQEQSRAFDEFRNGDPKLIKWLMPVVNGLHAISTSTVISTAASLVSSSLRGPVFYETMTNIVQQFHQAFPAQLIFSGIGVLLSVRVDLISPSLVGL